MGVLSALFGTGAWGTGGNLVAAAILGVAAYVARGWAGPRLAKWWHGHHGEHLRGELAEMEARLMAHIERVTAPDQPDQGGAVTPPPTPEPAPEPAPAPVQEG